MTSLGDLPPEEFLDRLRNAAMAYRAFPDHDRDVSNIIAACDEYIQQLASGRLDGYDQAVYRHSFLLAATVERFLARNWVRRWLALGKEYSGDEVLVTELFEQSAEMSRLRRERVEEV